MNAIQNPPTMLRMSDKTEEFRASRIFPAMNEKERIKKEIR
jgi:hypothetical protein